jgi:hypothetical protein
MTTDLARMARALIALSVQALAGWLLIPTTPVSAQTLRLEAASLPAPLVEGNTDKLNTGIEASAVASIGDGRRFLVAHDKAPELFVVDAATGRILGQPIGSAKFPAQSATGPKWEGMARDSSGNYYIIGAHSGKTDEERATKSVLLRFRLKGADTARPVIDDASVVRWDISRPLVNAMRAAGLDVEQVASRKIEGLAVIEATVAGASLRELVIGLREPGDKVRTFKANITGDPSPNTELELRPAFSFYAEPREGTESQLTSLEYIPVLGGFLVVTASEDADNVFHGNTLWFVAQGRSTGAERIATFEVAMKCEGLAVLGAEEQPRRTTVRLLLAFDNDAHATRIPSRYQMVTLVREVR